MMLANAHPIREDAAMDYEAAGLLDGLEGEERDARLGLLDRLTADGVPLEELKAAVDENRLALLPVDLVLGGRYTAAEIEQRFDVPAALLIRFRRLLGLPEPGPNDRVFGDDDIAAGRATAMFLDSGLPEDAVVEITRVLGEGMARLAASSAGAVVDAFLEPGDTEYDVAVRLAELTEHLAPALTPVLAAAYTSHLRESVARGMLGSAERQAGQLADAQEIVVCFADLVGFTRLGGEVEVRELGSVARRLARLAADVSSPPVRLVKTIGDAAMFVSPEPEPLVDVALSLVDAVQDADLPSLRAGIASGPAFLRSGDFYGHSVNLASRVTGVARPGSVLCTQEVRDAAPDAFEWSSAGRFRLKGVAEPAHLHRARRTGEHPEPPAREARKPRADRRRRRASS
jgi:adenylate cyclase